MWSLNIAVFFFVDDLIVLLKVLDLLHDLFENFGAVLWRIAVFYKADLDLQLQLIAGGLIVQQVSKRRFGVDNLFDLLRQSLALVVDDSTPSTSLSVPYSKSYWSRRARRIKIKKVAGEKILQQLCLWWIKEIFCLTILTIIWFSDFFLLWRNQFVTGINGHAHTKQWRIGKVFMRSHRFFDSRINASQHTEKCA